jgi:DNA-binding NarL/FixJ family response regulator
MSTRVPVFVYANDPISQAGIASGLRSRPEVQVLEEDDVDGAAVAIVVTDEIDGEAVRLLRAIQRNGCPRVVLVVSRVDEAGPLTAVGAGASALLRRSEATPERLARAVQAAAAGDGSVPPDLLGRLMDQVSRLHDQVLAPRGLTFSGLSEREVDVLRLVADGCDTAEIARSLCYSERTVKNVIHDVTSRLRLRNRSHAVAYVMRQGLI